SVTLSCSASTLFFCSPSLSHPLPSLPLFFFFPAPATTLIYTLSLHDALPIYPALLARLGEVRKKLRKPLAVGFGISEHAHYQMLDRKSTRLNSSHVEISYAVFCLKKKKKNKHKTHIYQIYDNN